MRKLYDGPSRGWRDAVFDSPPRRCVDTQSKSTTRVPVLTHRGWQHGEGGHETTALMLLDYLQRFGLVRRFKAQAFDLEEIGGPKDRIPDLLVELEQGQPCLHVLQIKSARFITDEVQQKFEVERTLLEGKGIGFHVWTDRDRVSRHTSQTVRMLHRGHLHPAAGDVVQQARAAAQGATTLAPLLRQFGWDDAISAAALGAFHINALEKIHENAPVYLHFPAHIYADLFACRSNVDDWWEGLAT
jgi:hypothetical protein